jgi:excisionase family DNA binding protein
MVAARRIPFIKISNRVRFERSAVVAWLERNRVPSREQP